MAETMMVKKEDKAKEAEKYTPQLRVPKVHVTENEKDDSIVLTIEMPGIGKKDVEVSLTENKLTVKGMNDRRYFKRTFVFRKPISHESIEANMKNGILTLVIKPKEAETHTIKIK